MEEGYVAGRHCLAQCVLVFLANAIRVARMHARQSHMERLNSNTLAFPLDLLGGLQRDMPKHNTFSNDNSLLDEIRMNSIRTRTQPWMLLFCTTLLCCGAKYGYCQPPEKSLAFTARSDGLGSDGIAMSGEIKIHFVTKGEGPLMVMIHGFPDYWYTWRKQIPELSQRFKVVAIDQRGFNESDQPAGVENYSLDKLVGDVRAVIEHFKQSKAIIVGHDWGGMVAWSFAMTYPEMTERLIILNLPHPNGFRRELANNPEQQKNSAYARFFQSPIAASTLSAEGLAKWVTDDDARPKYVEALRRSSVEGMLNYYKANYPKEPYVAPNTDGPRVKCSVLMIHGLKDKALLAEGLNDTWKWIDGDLTLVTIPNADHFVQQDASDLVTRSMVSWLSR